MTRTEQKTDRAKKIQLLKDLEAGKITINDLKESETVSVWMNLDGLAFHCGNKTRTIEEMAAVQKADKAKGKEWYSVTLNLD